MRAGGGDRTAVNEEDAVACGQGAGAMRDDDYDSIARERGQRFQEI